MKTLTREIFLKQVEKFHMNIRSDHGMHRHIRFRHDHGLAEFNLVTWPYHLCFSGDTGCYVFESREKDAFAKGENPFDPNLYTLHASRMVSEDRRRGGMYEWSRAKYIDGLIRQVRRSARHRNAKYVIKLVQAFFGDLVSEDSAREHIDIWNDLRLLTLSHPENCQELSHDFRWSCHAIDWGMYQYQNQGRSGV